MPAFAEQGGAADPAVPAEVVAAPGDTTTAATPAAEPAPRVRHTVALGPEGTDEQGRSGRVHTVVRGDTLWDISEAYLGTPWVWPSIWKENPRVANPNRIYPGNRIWIAPGEMRQISDDETAVAPLLLGIQKVPSVRRQARRHGRVQTRDADSVERRWDPVITSSHPGGC